MGCGVGVLRPQVSHQLHELWTMHLHSISASTENQTENEKWSGEILKGVTSLPRFTDFGNMADLLLQGDNAKPILTGAGQIQPSIAIAAAEGEPGGARIVAFTNIRYGLEFLNDNQGTQVRAMRFSIKFWNKVMVQKNWWYAMYCNQMLQSMAHSQEKQLTPLYIII